MGRFLKSDVIIAKNYLNEQEIKNLNNLVNLVENEFLKVFHYEVLKEKEKKSHSSIW